MNVVDEPSGSNEHTGVLPLPSSDVLMIESDECDLAQWDSFGVQTSPAIDARLFTPEDVNGEVTATDDKYWFDQVAILRRENADL
eukprot:490090-Karenia_brevis.AAC.1